MEFSLVAVGHSCRNNDLPAGANFSASAADCAAECLGRPECGGFVFAHAPDQPAWCFLKHYIFMGDDTPTPFTDCYSRLPPPLPSLADMTSMATNLSTPVR
jgi:hypothetical protein